MKNNQRIYIGLIISVLLFAASCEKVIKVKLPSLKPNLVINCTSDVGGPFMILVSKSASLSQRNANPDLSVTNASIRLYSNGVYEETITYDTLMGYMGKTYSLEGKQYTIKVSAPGFDDAEATVTAPSIVSISNLVLVPNARRDKDGNDQDELRITFNDPAGPGTDYYIVKMQGQHDTMGIGSQYFCINSNDASIETADNSIASSNTCLDNEGIFFRDILFNGKQKELKLYAQTYSLSPQFNGVDTQYATVELWHVSEAYFRYLKSYKVAKDVNGDPFSEPVNIYTNITNGLGIFAVAGRTGMIIR